MPSKWGLSTDTNSWRQKVLLQSPIEMLFVINFWQLASKDFPAKKPGKDVTPNEMALKLEDRAKRLIFECIWVWPTAQIIISNIYILQGMNVFSQKQPKRLRLRLASLDSSSPFVWWRHLWSFTCSWCVTWFTADYILFAANVCGIGTLGRAGGKFSNKSPVCSSRSCN